MSENAQKRKYLKIMDNIDEFTKDADWSVEELREDLLSEGINPDELIKTVRQNIFPFLLKTEENSSNENEVKLESKYGLISDQSELAILKYENQDLDEEFPTLLSLLRKFTEDMPSRIAQKLGINVSLMKGFSNNSELIPPQCKKELVKRVGNIYPFVPKDKVEKSIESPTTLKKAAFRDKEYSVLIKSYEEIIIKSNLDSESEKFWINLGKESENEISK